MNFEKLNQLAKSGDATAQCILGNVYDLGTMGVEQNIQNAIYWYEKSANQNNIHGQLCLGELYEKVLHIYDKAIYWYLKAIDNGSIQGLFRMGEIYDSIFKNYIEAAKWYLEAAKQGYSYAQNNIGDMYKEGQGVEQNYSKAIYWFMKADRKIMLELNSFIRNVYVGKVYY